MKDSSLLFITPQVRSRESYLLQLLSDLVPVSILSLYPPYRPIETRGPQPTRQQIVPTWKWIWPAERWVGDWTSGVPGSCSFSLVRELRRLRARDGAPRWIWFSGASMAGIVEEAEQLGYRVIVDQDRMPNSRRLRHASSHWSHWIRLPEMWRDLYYERRRCERAHAVIASSPLYASQVQKLAPNARIRVLGHSVDLALFEELRDAEGTKLVFCGDLEDPRQQAGVHWFSHEVLPRLQAALGTETPEVLVAGPGAPPEFSAALSQRGIRSLTWERNDSVAASTAMRGCLKDAQICFLPHQEPKAGFQFLLQSMAAGRPVVGTARSIEGLLFTPGRDIWMDDEPDAFTSSLIQLLRSPELRKKTVNNATDTLKAHYEWNAARSSLSELLQEL